MLVSVAEEMNPTRRNTMEDVHVAHPPGSWGAPDDRAAFLGVYDGHGGRLIADYLEDHLADNIAKEWAHSESDAKKKEKDQPVHSKKRRLGDDGSHDQRSKEQIGGRPVNEENDGKIIHTALERAFLLTDIQSRMDGITTSGATVVCCVVIPHFNRSGKNITSISIHAANVGDARAVLSSNTAKRPSPKSPLTNRNNNPNQKLPNPELPNELPLNRSGKTAVRITQDHKSTDPKEIARIEASGGIMIRGRVLGVLAVARSLGDHGLKEYVIGRPHLSTSVVRIQSEGSELNDARNTREHNSLVAPFTDGEFLIVACDGLWDVMEDQEAVDFVRNHVNKHGKESRDGVASHLIEEALRRGSTDNVTVIVYWL